jgi:hypothetical protein
MVKTRAISQPKGLREIDGDDVWHIYGGYYNYDPTGRKPTTLVVG